MTHLQAARALLRDNWQESVNGRTDDVPTPGEFVLQQDVSREDLKTTDVVRIVPGGDTTFEPRGFGWTHQKIEADVTVEIRTADRREGGTKIDGHQRLWGARDGTAEPDSYIGLAGEVRRILENHRDGFAEFCRVPSSTIRDESSAEGKNYYRADVDIAFIQEAASIDPAP